MPSLFFSPLHANIVQECVQKQKQHVKSNLYIPNLKEFVKTFDISINRRVKVFFGKLQLQPLCIPSNCPTS